MRWPWSHLLLIMAATCLIGPLVPGPARAKDDDSSFEETVVTASGAREPAFESTRAILVLHRFSIEERLPSTTPESLQDEVGITMQRTHSAGGAPILRGLLGQHVLLLVDGIRLNNAITPSGPSQLLNTVDPFQIQRVEVLRGPGSVLFGSDAMGGVINIITRKPVFDPRRAWDGSVQAVSCFDTADSSVVGNVGLDGHLRSVGLRAAGSLKRFDELVGGRDTGLQPFTGYTEGNADFTAAWMPTGASELRLSYSLVRQQDAPRSDRSSPTDFLRFTEQFRDLAALSYSGSFDASFIKQVEATLSFQQHRELRERFRLTNDQVEQERDDVSSLGARVALGSELPANRITCGLDFYHDWVHSSKDIEYISHTTREPQSHGRYVDGSRYLQLGIFALDRISLTSRLALDLGGRFSTWNVDIPQSHESSVGAVIADHYGGAGTLHGRYLIGSGVNLVAGAGMGFRAPNVDDYSALGCSAQGYDEPNPDLDAEKSLTAEGGIKLDLGGILKGSAFYFFTYLADMIVRVSATQGGAKVYRTCDTTTSGAPVLTEVMRHDNASSGIIHGVELDLQLDLGLRWRLFSWAIWTWGEVAQEPGDSTGPMSRIPPLSGLSGVRLNIPEVKGFAELAVRWAGPQDRLSPGDRSDLRICPDGASGCEGTDGYAVLVLRGAARVAEPVQLSLTIENITDETYRVHGSGIDGPGLSAMLGMEVTVK